MKLLRIHGILCGPLEFPGGPTVAHVEYYCFRGIKTRLCFHDFAVTETCTYFFFN